ncbi:hypothetical protein LEP1GSC198_3842 [Leptospira kirschneri str. JB]|nr:hypothetical protein LEP1GSC198_3842 [Leptospira kirschneri str. JB]
MRSTFQKDNKSELNSVFKNLRDDGRFLWEFQQWIRNFQEVISRFWNKFKIEYCKFL